jgi:hypothetical protein
MADNDLPTKMDNLAKSHPRSVELAQNASALRVAINGYWGEQQTVDVRKFVGAWARARRIYCESSGEPLI